MNNEIILFENQNIKLIKEENYNPEDFFSAIKIKENPELAVLIEKMNKTGFDRELGMTDDELSFSLHPDKYISIERGMELWNAYGYAEIFGDNKKEHIVLSENGKLYCLIKTNL